MGRITFQFEEKNKTDIIVDVQAGEMVLDVALDSNVDLHHNCGAVCACSTCHIYVEQGMDAFSEMTDKEEDFVDRARNPKFNSRLACQCVLQKDADIVITVPDQSLIIGH